MPLYKVIRKSDSAEVSRYDSGVIQSARWPLTEYEHIPFDPEAPPAYSGQWTITRLAFINRFTDAEWIAFDLTAIDNPSGSPAQRQQQSGMRLFMKKVELAQFIDLQRPDTRTGVQALEAIGLLGAGRATKILDTAPTEAEVWRA